MTQVNRVLHIAGALVLLGCLFAARAQADTILVRQSTMIAGTFSGVYSFSAPQAGTLSLRLENIAWPERLAALNCNLYNDSGMLGSIATDGTLSVAVTGAGTYFTHLFAQAAGALDLGLFSFQVSFAPSVTAVPLPAAGWLLFAALGAFGMQRRALPIVKFPLRRRAFT